MVVYRYVIWIYMVAVLRLIYLRGRWRRFMIDVISIAVVYVALLGEANFMFILCVFDQ